MIIDWELTGHGWARCRLSAADGQDVGLVCGYLTDALADLVAAASGLYGPARRIRFFFDDEPAELRWVLSRGGSEEVDDVDDVEVDDVEVTVYRFPDVAVSLDLPDSAGSVVWRSTQPRPEFAHAVLEAAEAVLARYGEDGYRERWGQHDYPVALVQDLRRLHLRDCACGAAHDQGAADAPEAAATSTALRRSQGRGGTAEPM
ncbi:hypothetical protein [Streptomyces sp900129855]|uniref:Uncharacterized protein n=1 Tax=Streptomyces sp. 900129855 TaxID=3155129 RepID=A0ABV2ZQ55_9ACTN